jgi:hypothetical protein
VDKAKGRLALKLQCSLFLLLLSPVGGHGAAGAAGRWLLRHNDGIVIVTLLAILVIVIAEQVHAQVLAQQQLSSVDQKKPR